MAHNTSVNASSQQPLRVLGIFAHPDDETICAGGTLAKYASTGADIRVVSLTKGEAEATVRGIKPLPWPSDYEAAATLLETAKETSSVQSYWLSSGQMEGTPERFIRVLQTQGGLIFIEPTATQRPILLRPDKAKAGEAAAMVEVNSGTPAGVPLSVQVLARDGRLIDSQDLITDGGKIAFKVSFDLPVQMQNKVNRMQVAGRRSAGSTTSRGCSDRCSGSPTRARGASSSPSSSGCCRSSPRTRKRRPPDPRSC